MCVQFGYYAEDPLLYQGGPFDKTRSKAWWDAWYQEVERVSLYTADLAEKHGIEMVAPFGGLLSAWGIAPEAETRFTDIINKMKQHYSGEIGSSQVIGMDPSQPGDPLPLAADIPAYDKYDFIGLGLTPPLTQSANPDQVELNTNATRFFNNKLRAFYSQYKKPIVILQAIFGSFAGMLQGKEYAEHETWLWAPYQPDVVFSSFEQAMAYEAIMKAIADAEYIVGIYPFGYGLEEFPSHISPDIRGKPAEQIVAGWYKQFEK